jgi:hypothetical protein
VERSRETEQNDLEQAVMRLQVDGVEHPSVASYARGLQKEAWLMVAAGAVVANSTRHWMAKMLRDGDTEDVAEQQMVVARIAAVRAELQAAVREAGITESDLDAVRAETRTPGGDAAAMNRVAMANARVEAELCSCGRAQCQACNWERGWSQEVVRASYKSLEEHKEPAREQREAAWRAELSSGWFRDSAELSQRNCGVGEVGASEQLEKGQRERQKQRKYEQRRRKRLELKQREQEQGSEQQEQPQSVQPVQLQGEQSELLEHLESEQQVQPQSVQPVQLQGEQSELLEHLESEQQEQPQSVQPVQLHGEQ